MTHVGTRRLSSSQLVLEHEFSNCTNESTDCCLMFDSCSQTMVSKVLLTEPRYQHASSKDSGCPRLSSRQHVGLLPQLSIVEALRYTRARRPVSETGNIEPCYTIISSGI
jgi:hypothetical protein